MEGIRLKQNYWALAGIIIVAVLLVIVVLEIKKREARDKLMSGVECLSDKDCVMQATSCCPCSMGGNEVCVSRENASIIQENLGNCSGVMCLAVYNCEETSCVCKIGRCVKE